jgi:hypothetical protein
MGTESQKRGVILTLCLLVGGITSACFEKTDLPVLDGSTDPAGDDALTDQIDTVPDRIDAAEDTGVDDPVSDIPEEPLCDPGSQWCEGADLMTCNTEGTGTTSQTCPLGCGSAGGAHCLSLVPSNMSDGSLLCVDGTTDLSFVDRAPYVRLDTDTGAIDTFDEDGNPAGTVRRPGEGLVDGINFIVSRQEGGPMLGVFSVQSMRVPAGTVAFGFGANALVILSCGDVEVEGRLSVDAFTVGTGPTTAILSGPGGYAATMGPGGGGDGTQGPSLESGGGGGAGFGGAGGTGSGAAGTVMLGGSAGSTYGFTELVPLQGGSSGGMGSDNDVVPFGLGGPAGGALQISGSGAIRIAAAGIVSALGFGGFGGEPGGAGGGGGSGGGILLEAGSVVIESGGIVAANGGGGGAGSVYSMGPGADGEPGQAGAAAAAGGISTDPTAACSGADGNSALSMDGVTLSCAARNGGGGGGGAGRIRLNALSTPAIDGIVSPDPNATDATATLGSLNLE